MVIAISLLYKPTYFYAVGIEIKIHSGRRVLVEPAPTHIVTNYDSDPRLLAMFKPRAHPAAEKLYKDAGLSDLQLLNLCGGFPNPLIKSFAFDIKYKGVGVIEATCRTDKYFFSRLIDFQKRSIINRLMRSYGGHHALSILVNQIKQAQQANFYHASLEAKAGRDFTGYYVWARFGFTPHDDPDFQQDFVDLLVDHSREEITLHELVMDERGYEIWRQHGFTWAGRFDFAKQSPNMNLLETYLGIKRFNVGLP